MHVATKAIEEAGVVPDVLKEMPTQDMGLEISFENQTLETGAKIPRAETTTKTPALKVSGALDSSGNEKYTIIMTDPDLFMKNDPTGQVRHWLQTGLSVGKNGELTSSVEPITPYLACAPGPGPAHRYVFILCQEPGSDFYQSAGEEFKSKSGTHDLKERMGFSAQSLIDKYTLEVVGLTFMTVAPDAGALVDNAKLGMESVKNKIMGQ